MASIQNLLKNAIWNAIKNDSDLWNSVGGRVFYMHPVAGVSFPYMTYSFAASGPFHAMKADGPVAYVIPVFFDIFSKSSVTTEAETIQDHLHALMDSASLSITGYSNVKFLRASEVTIFEEEVGIFHLSVGYDAIVSPE